MRVVIQRVVNASVHVNTKKVSSIKKGLLVFVGFEINDNIVDCDWITNKILNLRIFSNKEKNMELSVRDVNGDVLIVSQFTLHAKTKKGNRPSFIKSAKSELSKILYDKFILAMNELYKKKISQGIFGADMKIRLENDGPVTIIIDSKNKE
tara:strand:+ start:42982 stop:43434 length:453 start_codon:yes stop_codon:yes gene_type:complete